ncbi:hypothetical protein C8R46DRAFT_1228827 [Mycena filopes]|nr:hypothetical protein C8R46DRAFT_1228827 [Mycena filopes]
MHLSTATFLLALYASTQVVQATFVCDCETNGVVDNSATELCCEAATGRFFQSPCIVPDEDMAPFQTCCVESMGQGDGCTPLGN